MWISMRTSSFIYRYYTVFIPVYKYFYNFDNTPISGVPFCEYTTMVKPTPTEGIPPEHLAALCGIPSPIVQPQKRPPTKHPTHRRRQKYSDEDLLRALFTVLHTPGSGLRTNLDYWLAKKESINLKQHKLSHYFPSLVKSAKIDDFLALWISILSTNPDNFQGDFLLEISRPVPIAEEEKVLRAIETLISNLDVSADWLADSLAQKALDAAKPRLLHAYSLGSRANIIGPRRGVGLWWKAYLTSKQLREACQCILNSYYATGNKRVEELRSYAKEAESQHKLTRTMYGLKDKERRSPVSLRRFALCLWLRLCLVGWERHEAAIALNEFFHSTHIWKPTIRKKLLIASSAKNFERILYAELKAVLKLNVPQSANFKS
jgi:hypothetical protein